VAAAEEEEADAHPHDHSHCHDHDHGSCHDSQSDGGGDEGNAMSDAEREASIRSASCAAVLCAELSRVVAIGGSVLMVSAYSPDDEAGLEWMTRNVLQNLNWANATWAVDIHSSEAMSDMYIYVLRKGRKEGGDTPLYTGDSEWSGEIEINQFEH
jgi:hypothetical protein